jgi:arginine deiminase
MTADARTDAGTDLSVDARSHPRVDSEVGRLRTVMLHRPGPELSRLTPRNNDRLLFDGIPWVERAQIEHDAFAGALRSRGVEVLYLTDLLRETLGGTEARGLAVSAALADPALGHDLRELVHRLLSDLDPVALTTALTAGLRQDEVAALAGSRIAGLVSALAAPDDFVIDPLPNLLFTRDSSAWVGDQVAVTSLAMPARRRETSLTEVIYRHHPRFAGTALTYERNLEPVEGGDVLLLAPGVVAVGTGERTTPAGVERLAHRALSRGLAHTVLAVPIAQERATMHLDTVCTMVDVDAVVMYPAIAGTLEAVAMTLEGESLQIGPRRPFLQAAASAMGIEELRVIDTGLDPVTAEREQWDDGNNTLCIAPRLAVAYERNTQTNARLEAAGIDVVAISGSELGSGRGGPRCMSCPIDRDPL